ncbi:MAG: uroporphyrinogen-III synthase [Thermoplasmata archaeon]
MTRHAVVVGSPGTLEKPAEFLSRRGWRIERPAVIRAVPVPLGHPPDWLLRRPGPDVWVVTSRAVITAFWASHPPWRPPLRRIPEIWAVGPGTARALRGLGLKVHVAHGRGGQRGLLGSLPSLRGRRVVYLRSDLAGTDLARELRKRGARVRDRVVYRVITRPRLSAAERRAVLGADLWLVASPSALRAFRRALGPATFRKEARRVRAFALGTRTVREARRAGLGRVRVPARSTEEAFTKLVAKWWGDAPV